MKKILSLVLVTAMALMMMPAVTMAAEPIQVGNIGFIPNSGEASVSKVDLENDVTLARYYTAPRLGEFINLVGGPSIVANVIDPYIWRTSRIAMDEAGNAWVLNPGADAYAFPGPPSGPDVVQGSVVRIIGNVEGAGLTPGVDTNNNHSAPFVFGADDAVQVFPVGEVGDIPRAIAIDAEGDIWIGFYGTGEFREFRYTPSNPTEGTLAETGVIVTTGDASAEPPIPATSPYEAKIDKNGVLWFSSRDSTPIVGGDEGVFCFDTNDAVPVAEEVLDINPYSILIDNGEPLDDVVVWVTSYDQYLRKIDTNPPTITQIVIAGLSASTGELRGMSFDANGVIWMANTKGNNVCWYDPDAVFPDPSSGASDVIASGAKPVGVGFDANGDGWAICRYDGNDPGFIAEFNPVAVKAGVPDPDVLHFVNVGYRPYAYGEFVSFIPTYDICGFKYEDEDGGTVLEGWTIELYESDGEGGWDLLLTDDTDAAGQYCFENLLAGDYKVSEVLEEGWDQVSPISNEHLVTLPAGASDCVEGPFYNFVNSEEEESGICGYKFADWFDEAGEPDEVPLPGWTITLEKWDATLNGGLGDFAFLDSEDTDEEGKYCFLELGEGDYRVSETLKDGWDQVSPEGNEWLVTLPEDASDCEEGPFYDFHNTPHKECAEETACAAEEVGVHRFVPAPGNWFTYVEYDKSDPDEYPIFAGQTHRAGTLYVQVVDGILQVKYTNEGADPDFLEGYIGDWGFTEYHLEVVDDFSEFNDIRVYNKKTGIYGSAIPGQCEYSGGFEEPEEDTGWIDTDNVSGYSNPIFIFAHSVARWCGYDADAVAEIEGALGD